jgi:heme a synthase
VVPAGYAQFSPWWTNAFENPIAAQFHHRSLAIVVTVLALVLAWRAGRAALAPPVVRAVHALGAVVSVQLVLGVTTLLLAVPLPLGVLHQFTGVLALTAVLVATQRAVGTTWGTPAPNARPDAAPSRPVFAETAAV